MTRYKALLVGVSRYEAPGPKALPFVPQDLERMEAALRRRGFHKVQQAQARLFSPNTVNAEVTGFLAAAKPGDRLLVVLSGHGVHSDGKDYLVPEDFRPDLPNPITDGCVEIDWRGELESSRAAQVTFLIDACREGLRETGPDDDTMGLSQWSNRKVDDTLSRKVAYVYACSQAEKARFVRADETVRDGFDVGTEPGESFSLFSRTVTELLDGPVSTLTEFETAAQDRIDALFEAYGKKGRPQHLRVLSEDDRGRFLLFPPTQAATGPVGAERTWAEAVTGHPVWDLTAPAPAVEALKDYCGRLVAQYARVCAEVEPKVAEDPWYDPELAERTTVRVAFLLSRVAEGTELSPTEAALLAVLPFAAQTHWVRQAARQDLPTAELDGFLKSFPRLARRLRTLEQGPSRALDDIRWWGLHRWLVQHPDAFTPAFLTCENPEPPAPVWAGAELSTARLLSYIKEQRVAPAAVPGTTRSTALAEERHVAPATPHEHLVRERFVSALLKAAHALAVDPADLPEVLVEHLGISDSVSLDELRATLHRAEWQQAGAGRSLSALCDHPAVELALKRHAETVDSLLRDINKEAARSTGTLAPLASLPAYADAQQVGPSGTTPAELSSGIRFRLADDRVQELLMGEQLYGDRALAVRELYQNALDALRYRTARTEYLRRTGVPLSDWSGEVVFTEGVDDDGRPYLECADNGIGMGVTELSRAFAQGGSRFVDLPEYLEEGALWAALDPPVSLVPVSRFGLGVLSYFMIADELTVLTCRLDREGRPGRLLKVTIAGPGNLFRVEDLGPGREAGTRVRLHGVAEKPMPSSGEELGKYLWFSPYRVRAPWRKGGDQEWRAGELVVDPGERPRFRRRGPNAVSAAHTSPYDWSRRFSDATAFNRRRGLFKPMTVVACRQGMWWTDGNGAVLVDGIANTTTLFGRVVDLRGTGQARLSIDRKRLSEYDEQLVRERCLATVDDLVDAPDLLSPSWLEALRSEDPELAEAIAIRAAEKRKVWTSHNWTMDAGRTGFFPPDLMLLPAVTGDFPWEETVHDSVAALMILCMPETVLRWRLRALHTELSTDLPPALPSDLALLAPGGFDTWLIDLRYFTETFLASRTGAQHGLSAKTVLRGNHLPRWRSPDLPVELGELLITTARTGQPLALVAARLSHLGYDVPDPGPLSQVTTDDLPLLAARRSLRVSRRVTHDEMAPQDFLTPGACVPLAHLHLQDDPVAAARRLTELGCVVPARLLDALAAQSDDRSEDRHIAQALMCHPDAFPTSQENADRVTPGQLLYVSALRQDQPEAMAKRLTRLGFAVPDVTPLAELTEAHYRAASVSTSLSRLSIHAHQVVPVDFHPWHEDEEQIATVLADFGVSAHQTSDSPRLPVLPVHRRVAAALTNTHLKRPGPAYDDLLVQAFTRPETVDRAPDARATLAEIASAALRLRRPFREVAAKATELGLRHEAEDWFDAPAGPGGPVNEVRSDG